MTSTAGAVNGATNPMRTSVYKREKITPDCEHIGEQLISFICQMHHLQK